MREIKVGLCFQWLIFLYIVFFNSLNASAQTTSVFFDPKYISFLESLEIENPSKKQIQNLPKQVNLQKKFDLVANKIVDPKNDRMACSAYALSRELDFIYQKLNSETQTYKFVDVHNLYNWLIATFSWYEYARRTESWDDFTFENLQKEVQSLESGSQNSLTRLYNSSRAANIELFLSYSSFDDPSTSPMNIHQFARVKDPTINGFKMFPPLEELYAGTDYVHYEYMDDQKSVESTEEYLQNGTEIRLKDFPPELLYCLLHKNRTMILVINTDGRTFSRGKQFDRIRLTNGSIPHYVNLVGYNKEDPQDPYFIVFDEFADINQINSGKHTTNQFGLLYEISAKDLIHRIQSITLFLFSGAE